MTVLVDLGVYCWSRNLGAGVTVCPCFRYDRRGSQPPDDRIRPTAYLAYYTLGPSEGHRVNLLCDGVLQLRGTTKLVDEIHQVASPNK